MIKERLKEIDLKLTDLASYLKISRPTLYKYIESFDSGDHASINTNVLKLFKYITENEFVGKKSAINYILTNLVDEQELGDETDRNIFAQVKRLLITEPDKPKSRFIKLVAEKSDYDEVCEYLVEIYPLLRKRDLTETEIALLKPYDAIRNIIDTKMEV